MRHCETDIGADVEQSTTGWKQLQEALIGTLTPSAHPVQRLHQRVILRPECSVSSALKRRWEHGQSLSRRLTQINVNILMRILLSTAEILAGHRQIRTGRPPSETRRNAGFQLFTRLMICCDIKNPRAVGEKVQDRLLPFISEDLPELPD
jgi:hypothetical protein